MSERSHDALIALRQIQRKVEQYARTLARTEGLTPSQLKVLQLLTEYPEISVGWISEQTRLKSATITTLIDKLVERGMVSRRRCDTDRRRVWIRMEPSGRTALEKAPDLLQAIFEQRFEQLPDYQQAMLVSSLELVVNMLEAGNIDAAPVLEFGALDE
ncbi:MAG: MarR family transcriptional regulator [Ponticaulis sp.]|nr:MarR family transcriptional regulator [Ponticaulis sp.]